MVICLEQGADLHLAQLMPLPLTVPCFRKSRLVPPFWYRLTWVVPEKGPLNGCVCVRACACVCDEYLSTEYSHLQLASPLRELACHMRSYSVTCHPAEVTFPPLPQQSWYSILQPQRYARLELKLAGYIPR